MPVAVSQTATSNCHYSQLATKESEYSSDTDPQVVSQVCQLLALQPHSRLVDLGAGACRLAAALHKLACLKTAVVCVDPCNELLQLGAGLKGVSSCCQGGFAWAKEQTPNSKDGILIRQTIHHIPKEQLPELFTNLHSALAPGGRICITKRGDLEKIFPWPQGFYNKVSSQEFSFAQGSSDRAIMEVAGFGHFSLESREQDRLESKGSFFSQCRARFLSWMSELTDEEIEAGISQLDSRNPGKNVTITAREEFMVATKL